MALLAPWLRTEEGGLADPTPGLRPSARRPRRRGVRSRAGGEVERALLRDEECVWPKPAGDDGDFDAFGPSGGGLSDRGWIYGAIAAIALAAILGLGAWMAIALSMVGVAPVRPTASAQDAAVPTERG